MMSVRSRVKVYNCFGVVVLGVRIKMTEDHNDQRVMTHIVETGHVSPFTRVHQTQHPRVAPPRWEQ